MAWNSDKQSGHPINAVGSKKIIPQSSGVVNSGAPLAERLDTLSAKNEAITVEEAKRASGFGDEGAKLLTRIVNESKGATYSKVNDASQVEDALGQVGQKR